MRDRVLFRAAVAGALYAASGCAAPEPAAIVTHRYSISREPEATPGVQRQTSDLGLRVSSTNSVRVERYPMPPDFDADVSLHPFTSMIGPCPEGVLGAHCAITILPSHYNR
jgi:hypothetical protein